MKCSLKIVLLQMIILPVLTFSQAKKDITTHQVTEKIYMLEGRGGNIGLCIGEDGVFMIDDQFAPLTPKILAAIKTVTDKPVKFLIEFLITLC